MFSRRPAIQDGSANDPLTAGPLAVSRQYADKQADQTVQQALAGVLAGALQHRCFDYSIDTAWLSATHDSWRTIISTAIHKNSMSRRLPAGTNIPKSGAAGANRDHVEAAPETATQVNTVDTVIIWPEKKHSGLSLSASSGVARQQLLHTLV